MDKSDEIFDEILKSTPGAKRAAQGVIIEKDGVMLHLHAAYDKEETEELTHEEHFLIVCCNRDEILKLRKISSAEDYLLWLRAEAIADCPRACRVFRNRKNKIQNWSLTNYYSSNHDYHNDYIEHVRKGIKGKLPKVPAGMALINDANAMCIKSPHGNVVVVSEALEHFLYYMNLVFLGYELELDSADVSSALAIAVRIMIGSESLDFDLDTRGKLPGYIDKSLTEATYYQLLFTYGHEYAHHLLGHLSDSKLSYTSIKDICIKSDSKGKTSKYILNHKMEYEADLYAIKNIKSNNQLRSNLANAAFTMFIYFDIVDAVFQTMALRSNISHTHPKPIDRINKLRKQLNKKFGMTSEEISSWVKFAEKIKQILIKDWIPYRWDELEKYGSIYLPSYKSKILKDRIDF